MNLDERAIFEIGVDNLVDELFTFKTEKKRGIYGEDIETNMRVGKTGRTLKWSWPFDLDGWKEYEEMVIQPKMREEFRRGMRERIL